MNLISSGDLDRDEIKGIFSLADRLVANKERLSLREHSTVALLFTEPSTRTRVSFEVAVAQLGGMPIYVDAKSSQLSRGEELSDTARILSLYCDFIAVRTNSHDSLLKMAESAGVPVINALTELEHPTQALADTYTLYKRLGDLKGRRIAFLGDIAANTANSLMLTCTKLGAEVSLVGPRDWKPRAQCFNKAREYGRVYVSESMEEGLDGADAVYTDTFVSMGEEASAERRRSALMPYQLNSAALSNAKSGALVMHPLPAHRGEEITAEVIDGPQSVVWEQARNKLLIEKAVLLFLSEESERTR